MKPDYSIEQIDLWKVEEREDRTGYSWFMRKDTFPTLEDCLIQLGKDENFIYHLLQTSREKRELEAKLLQYHSKLTGLYRQDFEKHFNITSERYGAS